jgi:HPt (histidine-containing phosphotransfer) domain-containing protein
MPQQLEEMKKHLAQDNTKLAGALAHKIKGAASCVRGEALTAVAARMEKAGQAGNLTALKADYPSLSEQFRLLKEAMLQSSPP